MAYHPQGRDWPAMGGNTFGDERQICPRAYSGRDIDACLLNETWRTARFWRRLFLEQQLFCLLQAGPKYYIRERILCWQHVRLVTPGLPFIFDPVGPFGKKLSVDHRAPGSARCRDGVLRILDRSANF